MHLCALNEETYFRFQTYFLMLLQVFLSIDAVEIIGYKSCGDLSLLLQNTTGTFGGYRVVISNKNVKFMKQKDMFTTSVLPLLLI